MASPVQLPDLRLIEEPGSSNSTGRDQEVCFPSEFIQHVSDVLLSANSTIVKSKKYGGACRGSFEQDWRSDRATRKLLGDSLKMLSKLRTIEFVHIGVSAEHPTRVPAACRNYIVKQECDGSHG